MMMMMIFFLMIAEDVCIDDAVIGPRGGEFLNGC
jgi:hypothetical protein